MRISPHYNANAAGDLPDQEDEGLRVTSSSSSGSDQYTLTLTLLEWSEVRDLLKFAEAAVEYDCREDAEAFNHRGFPPEVTRDNSNWRSVLSTISDINADSDVVEISMSRSDMRHMFLMLHLTMVSEKSARWYYGGMDEDLQIEFPSLTGSSKQYWQRFWDAMTALDDKKGASIDLHAPGM